MSFILHNHIFDIIISILIILNIIFTFILSIDDLKKDLNKSNNNDKLTKIQLFKIIIAIIYIIVIAIFIIKIAKKYNVASYLTLIYYLSFVIAAIKLFNKNIKDLTTENKMSYIMTTSLFLVFFSTNVSQIYLNTPLNVQHTFKEYLLLAFLSIKFIFFIFCIIINLSILASNFAILFNKPLKKSKELLNKFITKRFELQLYDFYLSNKCSKKLFALDIIIFIILCPFQLIAYLLFALFILFIRFLLRKILNFCSNLTNYLDNSKKVISKALKISTILSLLIVYIIAAYNPKIICETTKDVYNLFITVILIPIIYDSIKSNRDNLSISK